MFDPLSVTLTMPPDADLKVWVPTRLGRRVILERTGGAGACRPRDGQARCAVVFEPLGEEDPGIWTVGVGKRSPRPATAGSP